MKKKAFRLTTRRSKKAKHVLSSSAPLKNTQEISDYKTNAAESSVISEHASPTVQPYQAEKEPSQNEAYLKAKLTPSSSPEPTEPEALEIKTIQDSQDQENSDDSILDSSI